MTGEKVRQCEGEARCSGGSRGFTLVELLITCAIVVIMAAIGVPLVQNAARYFRTQGTIQCVTGAIRTTRFQAISHGYPYEVIFNSAANTYQVQSDQNNNGTWANVGGAIPIPGVGLGMSQSTTLVFKPNGMVTASAGSTSFNISSEGHTQSITVSLYGNVTIH